MQRNYMKEVAQMFRKELGEPFCIFYKGSSMGGKFTDEGLYTDKSMLGVHWKLDNAYLTYLLTGQAQVEAVPKAYTGLEELQRGEESYGCRKIS